MLTSNKFTYKYFQNKNSTYSTLSHIADVASGIFVRNSKLYVLDSFKQEINYSTGYSRYLNEYVKIDLDVVMPFLRRNDDIAFLKYDTRKKEQGIVLLKTKSVNKSNKTVDTAFIQQYPYLLRYINQIVSSVVDGSCEGLYSNVNILSSKQTEIFRKEKHVLTINDRCCQSFYDVKARYAISKEMYGIHVKENVLSPKVLTAIFNSAFFCYLRFYEEFYNKSHRNSRYESILKFPIPIYKPNKVLISAIERVVDCLINLKNSRDDVLYSSDRREVCISQMLDMMIFELYLPKYMNEKNISISEYLHNTIFNESEKNTTINISDFYHWFLTPDNKIRQKMMLLDTRSPELLYPIYMYPKR